MNGASYHQRKLFPIRAVGLCACGCMCLGTGVRVSEANTCRMASPLLFFAGNQKWGSGPRFPDIPPKDNGGQKSAPHKLPPQQ